MAFTTQQEGEGGEGSENVHAHNPARSTQLAAADRAGNALGKFHTPLIALYSRCA